MVARVVVVPIAAIVGAAIAIVVVMNPAMGLVTTLARGSDAIWYSGWSEQVGACLWMLVPGTAAFTVSKVLQADLAARDRLQTCVNAQLVVLVTMLALDVLLIPTYEAVGAAAASTVSYVIGTIYTLWAYGRETGTPLWRCLFVHRSDLRYIREIVVAILGKLRSKRA